jgi:hypothetical protein
METADLNSDGKLDLVLSGGANVKVRLGFGDGTFQEPIRYPFEQASCPIIADFNGDGVPDVALSSTSWYRQGIILLGNGDGTFRNGAVLPGQVDLVAGDFNNDGKQDLAVAAKGSVGIMLGNGDGTFQAISLMRKGQVGRLRSGDFNSDGKLDVVGIGTNASGAATASMYLGSGDGTLLAAKNIWVMEGAGNGVSSSITAMVAADFDRDGKLDLAISFYSNDVAILRGDGTGGFQPRSLYLGGKASLVAGDFDGNGTTDLVTSVGTVAVMLNQP